MRFTSFIVAGVFALTASAQTTTDVTTTEVSTTATGTSTAAVATNTAEAAITDCLKKCAVGDVNCQAHCITVPSPDETAVNKTNECSNNCVQGNGTAAETEAYGQCLQDCVEEFYFSSSVGTPTGAGAVGSDSSAAGATASVTAITSTVTSGSSTFTTTFSSTATNKATGTGSSASGASATSTSSGNAGDVVFRPASSYVGLLGAIAALLAL